MPRQTGHDWLLSGSHTVSHRTKAFSSAGRYDRLLRLEPLEARLALSVLTVNSLADGRTSLGDSTVTLRDAIPAANMDVQVSTRGPSGSDEIRFLDGLSGTILALTGGNPAERHCGLMELRR